MTIIIMPAKMIQPAHALPRPVVERERGAGGRPAGIREQEIDAAKLRDRGLVPRGDAVRAAQIGRDRQR